MRFLLCCGSLLAAGGHALAALVGCHTRRQAWLDRGRPAAPAGRAVRPRLRSAAVWAPQPRPARLERVAAEAAEAVIAGVSGQVLELRLGARRPPDQPDGE